MREAFILILFTLSCIPASSFAQQKGDNGILISAKHVTKEKIYSALVSSGYPVDKPKNDYFTTQTINKKGSASIKLSVYRLDSSNYVVQGWFIIKINLYGGSAGLQQIVFKGFKGGAMKQAWEEMDIVAKKINEQVTYFKQ